MRPEKRRKLIRIFLIAFSASLILGIATPRLKGLLMRSFLPPVPSPEEAYPHAPAMPPLVATPVADMLGRYENFLRTAAPQVFSALQAGLTDSEIDALQTRYKVTLPSDLRALYRWRNGTNSTVYISAFPDHIFEPLDVALKNRDDLRKQVNAETPEQQAAYAAFAGHRDGWVGLIMDAAGDGYFFDPGRSEAQGSFFFCMAEDGYIFFPAFRNYLAAVTDGQKSGIFVVGPHGIETNDFVQAQKLWAAYGARPPL